ncbi:hypothetical protein [Mycolicibacterium iranicum]|uniref:UspA domain-containing protein n=1 Tax=Mycolicibacterium iranicum TaxID=912594 RepID=A0A178LYI8_MYCIR|nr:hypothetical protein [Mycolicibacterium iranicum]OAN39889.1 hypothetical protein A4X20_16190 [Mycolicibacterium iranicum]
MCGQVHDDTGQSDDCWVVAVLTDEPRSAEVLSAAFREAAVRGAAVMVLAPPGGDAQWIAEWIDQDPEHEIDPRCDIWVLPAPTDVLDLLLTKPDFEHVVVTSDDNATLVGAFARCIESGAMPENFSLIVVPRTAQSAVTNSSETCVV